MREGWLSQLSRYKVFAPAPRLADPAQLARIRRDLPILIAFGDADLLVAGGVLLE